MWLSRSVSEGSEDADLRARLSAAVCLKTETLRSSTHGTVVERLSAIAAKRKKHRPEKLLHLGKFKSLRNSPN